ncbi:MAG: DNA-directed RNA polymerase subunit omega [Alkalibacterium gilvum]|uniref:DNA-directed RNA polymerase subunit omega n=1 Tax=Alkalibacterium gilvum TaxID=1130080 RepID=A0A1H6QV80_9LACT|nr:MULTISPECIES: DNA-directed RNA polymerase subunit omega [Alkalibacterium]MDN6293071.1 DNA-directed RNA polymerase subunit omega [Alkalibacterium sp.]MDN6294877.1 DNA-directed RNA polymerase subunit omega [Alkalibacterium sp.]MDN6397415.1 DNA-directed RNA polymerase subunit omega [Alkalibacterium sp.]MDN6728874.1 DNA-directed RNA polymerase subunit omega [Alkalibacterium sp.]SEI47678.1 DNA-directed RNA polymerase subunit omega [Alkalibacterium gilvum]
MLLYPSQDDLLKKIDSKYSLVILAAKRAKQLHNESGTEMLEEYKSVKNVGKSLEEIISEDLVIDPNSVKNQ